ncbi:hypothetical protein OG948_30300 [Embleya sp. NBC_00888]|uniref:hypothetical protein n=1 Tax=Embleya sp. NBC_00888 TaxID=2975960 RepID=UPI003868EADC|nr:hypothetical protein OG948_30300 [Embleya sp. NBC_00888]
MLRVLDDRRDDGDDCAGGSAPAGTLTRARVPDSAESMAQDTVRKPVGEGSSAAPRGWRGRLWSAPLQLLLFLWRTLCGEWRGIVADPVRQLWRTRGKGLTLAVVASSAVIFFHAIGQTPTGKTAVRLLGGVSADLPLWLALLRTPISLFVPALNLPVWAGITQLFLAFAIAQLSLGAGRTLMVAYVTTLAGTMGARIMIAIGPDHAIGLPSSAAHVLDTGPSAAVVGLFTYLSIIHRAPILFTITGGSMVLESLVLPNLAGREHLIAVGAAIVLGLLAGRTRPRWLAWTDGPRARMAALSSGPRARARVLWAMPGTWVRGMLPPGRSGRRAESDPEVVPERTRENA